MAEPARGIELSDGDEFAGYRVERRLGRGGMGILYLAIEPGLERRVALKLIAPEAASDEVFARRFAEESRIAASIEHPNVVPIYAAGEEAGVPYIAMRYVAGADLARRLVREGRLPPQVAVDLIVQIGNGLDAIHAAGLIHRDVKPANVLLSGGDHAYITDFGVARNVATESGLTQTGRFVGTLDYVAPEQISGGAIDARVDVYALGCLLFKLLTGEVPFPKDGEAARLYAHLNDPPPAPSLYVPEVSMALDDVVIRAMSKSPDDRYPSAGDLGRAAQAALRGEHPAAPERTVATGAAATRTAETVAPTAPAREPGSPTEQGLPPTDETAVVAAESRARRGSRRWAVVGGAAALVAAVVIVIVLVNGGGGNDSSNTGEGGAASTIASKQKDRPAKPKPKPLSKSELIAAADAICETSQSTYTNVLSPELEEVPNVEYATTLSGISRRGVERFRQLEPKAPSSVEPAFAKYVRAQERVMRYDRQALEAAEAEDASAYVAARHRRDAEEPERYALAREIGLEQCSLKRSS
ncbi:MAG TPA: serine/threonine-protein kinase [Solirubrobacterales bacterium]|jgi:serine/threonine protein kinase|nr:serine/threonine-protein kinase [Solirubrobacterales bacterium]